MNSRTNFKKIKGPYNSEMPTIYTTGHGIKYGIDQDEIPPVVIEV
jgi:hypothetical protein